MTFHPENHSLTTDDAEIPFRGGPRGAVVVFGGQAGSEGKGAIAAHLARKAAWGGAVCNFMTNAGHTFVHGNEKVVVQQLPMALVSDSVDALMIGPGSAITPERLENEINTLDDDYDVSRRLMIHPRAMIIEDEDRELEALATKAIASTMKGCGAALARKTMRGPTVKLARDVPWMSEFVGDTTERCNDIINSGHGLLVEGAQGFDLDINHGYAYPYCTSRGTTPMATLADAGIDGRLVTRNIAVLRTYPIRVGNVVEDGEVVGYSGDYGSREVSFGVLGQPEETTTVTGKVRRIFEFDFDRVCYMSRVCRPTDVALTFADYVEPKAVDVRDWQTLSRFAKIQNFIFKLENAIARPTMLPKVRLIKTGPDHDSVVDMIGAWTL